MASLPTKTHLIIGLVMLKRPLGSLTFTEWQQLSHLPPKRRCNHSDIQN